MHFCRYKVLPMLTGIDTFFSCLTSIPLSVISVVKIVKMTQISLMLHYVKIINCLYTLKFTGNTYT